MLSRSPLSDREAEEGDSSGLEEEDDDYEEVCEKSYKRGPYKSYTEAEKTRAVTMFLEDGVAITEVSKRLGIPCKNIKRWATEGTGQRRGGGRRKNCPTVDNGVYQWLRERYPPGSEVEYVTIQHRALSISDDPNFKGSRGWAIKFANRFALRRYYVLK